MKPAVYIVGAGPGDPELMTLKARRLIEEADLILFTDSLLSQDVTRWARPEARVLGSSGLTLEEILALIQGAVAEGKTVVRLHTGDPSLYGAIHEQAAALQAAGIPYEIVPGVTSATAAAAALGVEFTVPDLTQTLIITRAEGRTPMPPKEQLRDLAAHGASIVLFLSAGLIERVTAELVAGGYSPDTPAAVAYRVSWPDERLIRGRLDEIAQLSRQAGITQHALILVGPALDPGLGAPAVAYRSRLYDPTFSHGFRRATKGG